MDTGRRRCYLKTKMKIKMGIDFLMTVLLFLLMSYQITGQKLHEWFGTGMLVLFLLHNILNIRWYGSLFKGKYTLLRAMQTSSISVPLFLCYVWGSVELYCPVTFLRDYPFKDRWQQREPCTWRHLIGDLC